MRQRTAGEYRAKRRLHALRVAIAAAEQTLAAMRSRVDAERVDRMSIALSDTEARNVLLNEENLRVAAEVDSMQAALRHAVRMTETDELTQLSTRSVLWDRLTHDIATSARRGAQLAVFFLDLDGFKGVNDRHGHAAGDRLLQHVATCLRLTVRAGDTLCRLGGDEFVLVFCDVVRADVGALTAKIHEALAAPCIVGGATLEVRASVGASIYPDDGEDPGSLLREADAAMYGAKGSKRAPMRPESDGPLSSGATALHSPTADQADI